MRLKEGLRIVSFDDGKMEKSVGELEEGKSE
jgi:hypothetical protein